MPSKPKQGRPPIHSAKEILENARGLPLEDLTMAGVAKRMGVPVTSLYRHFRNKDALLAALAAEILEDLQLPTPIQGDWRNWLVEAGMHLRGFCLNHPQVFEVNMQVRLRSSVPRLYEPVFDVLGNAGFDAERTLVLWSGVTSIAINLAQQELRVEAARRVENIDEIFGMLPDKRFPLSQRAWETWKAIDNADLCRSALKIFVAGVEDPGQRAQP